MKRRAGLVALILSLVFGAGVVADRAYHEEPRAPQATPFLGAHQGEVFYLCSYTKRTTVGVEAVEFYQGKCKAPGDKSTYWVPVLYRNDVAMKPSKMHVYLRNKVAAKPSIFPTPFNVSIGNAAATSPQTGWTDRYFWQCGDTKASTHYATPPNCPNATNGQGETALTLIFRFGQCWDGAKLTWPVSGACPSGTKLLVRMEPHFQYLIADGGSAKMRLSSGSIYGIHAGFVNGFVPSVLQDYIDSCIDKGISCHVRSDGTY